LVNLKSFLQNYKVKFKHHFSSAPILCLNLHHQNRLKAAVVLLQVKVVMDSSSKLVFKLVLPQLKPSASFRFGINLTDLPVAT
jgi:hypothetical protein